MKIRTLLKIFLPLLLFGEVLLGCTENVDWSAVLKMVVEEVLR